MANDRPPDPLRDMSPPRPRSRRGRRRRYEGGPGLPIAVAVLLLVVAAATAWWWFSGRSDDAPTLTGPVVSDSARAGATTGETQPELGDLPPLEESDGPIRAIAERLSAHPRWAAWLVTDRLVERFAGAVASLAADRSPREQVPFMVPEAAFSVQEDGDRLVVDPASFRRYDAYAEAIDGLDVDGAVRLYRQVHPLLSEAYAELGLPAEQFDADFLRAMENLIAVDVPEATLEVREGVEAYEFVDPALEARTPAEKHMFRMGPQNAARVQAKLRTLVDALEAAGVGATDAG